MCDSDLTERPKLTSTNKEAVSGFAYSHFTIHYSFPLPVLGSFWAVLS